jgi:hypothetical protein
MRRARDSQCRKQGERNGRMPASVDLRHLGSLTSKRALLGSASDGTCGSNIGTAVLAGRRRIYTVDTR